jgi:hypothetical protein
MPKVLAAILILAAVSAAKDRPDSDYAVGVLLSHKTVQVGMNCRTTGDVTNDGAGGADIVTTSNCGGADRHEYVVQVGTTRYTLVPIHKHSGSIFDKPSTLYLQPMSTQVKVRIDKQKIFVKVGDRESAYWVANQE